MAQTKCHSLQLAAQWPTGRSYSTSVWLAKGKWLVFHWHRSQQEDINGPSSLPSPFPRGIPQHWSKQRRVPSMSSPWSVRLGMPLQQKPNLEAFGLTNPSHSLPPPPPLRVFHM